MLFNSYEFIFAFLPVTLLAFWWLKAHTSHGTAVFCLVCCSLFFYGWWNPAYLVLLLASITGNYLLSRSLAASRSKGVLILGVTLNLALLAYYKYFDFFMDNLHALKGGSHTSTSIVLPLAISFFTFQQIAFLVDTHQGISDRRPFVEYVLFVGFFPQLIAGPIVHHKEMLPQFARLKSFRVDSMACGVTLFAMGLFKKAVIADGVAVHADPVFAAAATGAEPTFIHAWLGALAYTFQLYFDFSGYSDMAIGLALMFGIKLPANFNSPYKATTISDFWRCWHMTLSRFLRDYLYFPLGGNRRGGVRRYTNLIVTMLLGGLWHGAGWTFVIWGGLHGLYLAIQHAWSSFRTRMFGASRNSAATQWIARLTTFVAVVVGWVFFRATDLSTAWRMVEGMVGLNGITVPAPVVAGIPLLHDLFGIGADSGTGQKFVTAVLWVVVLSLAVWFVPNSQQLLKDQEPVLDSVSLRAAGRQWRPTRAWAVIIGLVLGLGVLALPQVSEFLYFQF